MLPDFGGMEGSCQCPWAAFCQPSALGGLGRFQEGFWGAWQVPGVVLGSLAGSRRGFGWVCAQLQVLEVFAPPLELLQGWDRAAGWAV